MKQANSDWFVESVRSDFESAIYTQTAIPRQNDTYMWNERKRFDYSISEMNLQFSCQIGSLTGYARGRIYFCQQTPGWKLDKIRQSISRLIEQQNKQTTTGSSGLCDQILNQ